ncbi:nitroreductase family protein [Caproicibacter sp. BJN0012]|uniref:nitroreductase family protein n=1 Tax=Caproicibacter sp. BJN0012 TaxID=3110227 RepID=UPI002E0F59D4
MKENFLKALESRRSIYSIGRNSAVTEDEILSIVRRAVSASPSAFNSQSSRVIVLFGKNHDRLWDDLKGILKGMIPTDRFAKTEEKIDSFRSGYGTVLYFEDQDVVTGLQNQFPPYKDNFPLWSLQSSGMLQLAVWAALEEAGLGASLQHYNPLIDEKVRENWGAPKSWKLLAQMPFGSVEGKPESKDTGNVDERVKAFR